MNIKKRNLFIIWILTIFSWIWFFIYSLFWQNIQKVKINKHNKENIISQKINNNFDWKVIKTAIKKQKKDINEWIFTDKAHQTIIESKWKDYIIDFKYGVWYVNKFWNIFYGIDPKIKDEREQIQQKVINQIKNYCKLNKFTIKDYWGLKWMKNFFDKLLTYYNWNIFLDKEKIDITQKYIEKYCKTYNPLLKEIIKKSVVLSFFDFDTNWCKININWTNSVNIICNKKWRNWKCSTRGKFYISYYKAHIIKHPTFQKKEFKIPAMFLIK